jgi:hypothetical protein
MDKLSSQSSFWYDSMHSMHPSLRVRYYQWFSMVEAMDRNFDSHLDLWRNANAAALQNFRALVRQENPGSRVRGNDVEAKMPLSIRRERMHPCLPPPPAD